MIGFPCDQFGHQEPGDDDAIDEFCRANYGVTFPLSTKVDVNGKQTHPVFAFLKAQAGGRFGSAIKWNFTKFLVGPDGDDGEALCADDRARGAPPRHRGGASSVGSGRPMTVPRRNREAGGPRTSSSGSGWLASHLGVSSMSMTRVLALFATAVLVVAACSSTGATPAPIGGGASSAAGAIVNAASSPTFGMVLTGPNGMTLYTHTGDSATSSTCSGSCATAWPPLATTGQPTAGTGVTGQLGTLARADGTTQVTYAGLPLYYWQGDTKAGDVTGNGVNGFSVATVSGSAPAPAASAAAPSASSAGKYGY